MTENKRFTAKREFIKIIEDYYIKLGDDGQLFSMHKPSDIRALVYLLNKKQGFTELQCEYNDLDIEKELSE
jgi:hypothetical protein